MTALLIYGKSGNRHQLRTDGDLLFCVKCGRARYEITAFRELPCQEKK